MRRPWGHLDRWLDQQVEKSYDIIGVCGFEDRSTTALRLSSRYVRRAIFLHITPNARRSKDVVLEKIVKNKIELDAIFPAVTYFYTELLDPPNDFVEMIRAWLDTNPKRILVDMSSMPKRFIAVLLKNILKNPNVEEVLVTNTVPEKYTQDALAEDQEPVSTFPAFAKTDMVDVPIQHLVMGLGYIPFDLPSVLDSIGGQPSQNVIFPFPPGSPSFQRNWKLLSNLFGASETFPEPIRVDSKDVSYAFDVIDDITNGGIETAVLLPYGPKPHSLAMILHSIYRKSEVQYTQPTYYNPDYSSGIKMVGGREEVYAYALRLEGADLFADVSTSVLEEND